MVQGFQISISICQKWASGISFWTVGLGLVLPLVFFLYLFYPFPWQHYFFWVLQETLTHPKFYPKKKKFTLKCPDEWSNSWVHLIFRETFYQLGNNWNTWLSGVSTFTRTWSGLICIITSDRQPIFAKKRRRKMKNKK